MAADTVKLWLRSLEEKLGLFKRALFRLWLGFWPNGAGFDGFNLLSCPRTNNLSIASRACFTRTGGLRRNSKESFFSRLLAARLVLFLLRLGFPCSLST